MEVTISKQQIKATIMVVEDDPLQRKLIKAALEMAGHTVVEAKDGVEALQLLDESAPDLIIADINMPNIDGLELLKALRANLETDSIPFLLTTANSSPEDINRGFALGADDYLTKPISLVELQARVSAKISRPTVPADKLQWDLQTGLLSENGFLEEVRREILRAGDTTEQGFLAYISLHQSDGERLDAPTIRQIIALAKYERLPLEIMGSNAENDLLILFPNVAGDAARVRLSGFSQHVMGYTFVVADEGIKVSCAIGYVPIDGATPAEQLLEQARAASLFATQHPHLQPIAYDSLIAHEHQIGIAPLGSSRLSAQLPQSWRSAVQIGTVICLGIVLALFAATVLRGVGLTGNGLAYGSLLIGLLLTGALLWLQTAGRSVQSSPTSTTSGIMPLLPAEKVDKPISTPSAPIAATVMVVEDDPAQRRVIAIALKLAGYEVVEAKDGVEALQLLDKSAPDLIITDISMPTISGLELLQALRANPETENVPFILVSARNAPADIAAGFQLGADDYLSKPISLMELQARVSAKLRRPSIPAAKIMRDRQTGLLNMSAFLSEVNREVLRARDVTEKSCLVCVSLSEREAVNEHFGKRINAPILKQMIAIADYDKVQLEVMGTNSDSDLLILIPEAAIPAIKERLHRFSRRTVRHTFIFGEENVRLTPIVGYVLIDGQTEAEQLLEQAEAAALFADIHLDLQAVEFQPSMAALAHERTKKTQSIKKVQRWKLPTVNWRTSFQVTLTIAAGLFIPFVIYTLMDRIGLDITPTVYIFVVIGLFFTSLLIWWEGILALRRIDPPEVPNNLYPPASAIIAAYLPNEAVTIEATIEAFLRVDYPAPIQVILAYNTPRDLPIERVFAEIASRNTRFIPFRVKNSTSKAQNVNAALALVRGKFVGVFDADHHPDADSFRRAWRWLANGYHVVQGHCLVRNGDASWVARMVAVEFEAIYAVSHPGRSRLHNFGIFGGSNGYWKTDLLRETRMHGFMLTEDIDSSFRVISNGFKIANDPFLISRELATTTLKALWNQRMRWAQGWYQVTLVQAPRLLRSKSLTLRQKLGVFHLLVWREIYPWLSWQMIPIIAFWARKYGGLDKLDWLVPIFVLTSIFTISTGPLQLLFVRRLADETIRKRRRWIWWYLLMTSLFYVEYKNLIARVAQIKEIMGERVWKVTARS